MAQFRPDFDEIKNRLGDPRSPERIIVHYLLERKLSDRLRSALPKDRASVYNEVYNELFDKIKDHPQKIKHEQGRVDRIIDKLSKYLDKESVFVEVGCGDAAVSLKVAQTAAAAYGIDITDVLITDKNYPSNFRFVMPNGSILPIDDCSVDIVFSDQLIEHLHSDDMKLHLDEVYRILKSEGIYICITPSFLTGPHDISCYFDYTASCFHLQEYTYRCMKRKLADAGFRRVAGQVDVRYIAIKCPILALCAFESVIMALPVKLRSRITKLRLFRAILGLCLIVTK
jgi:ubiquinone/menaquinone biosynthesis C-methylase UbiE